MPTSQLMNHSSPTSFYRSPFYKSQPMDNHHLGVRIFELMTSYLQRLPFNISDSYWPWWVLERKWFMEIWELIWLCWYMILGNDSWKFPLCCKWFMEICNQIGICFEVWTKNSCYCWWQLRSNEPFGWDAYRNGWNPTTHLSHEKKTCITFHYTVLFWWGSGDPIMVYHNPHITG